MAKNAIQFQKGLSLAEFMELYGTENSCRETLIKLRWPDGFICPHCNCRKHSYHSARHLFQCSNCRRQTSVKSGTIMHASKLPLTTWFVGMYLVTQSKNDIASLELKRHLGTGYDAAWSLKHKLMSVMAARNETYKLTGDVQIDDAVLGGKKHGKRGRGSKNKIPFVIAVSTVSGRPRYVHLRRVMRFSKLELKRWAEANLEKGAKTVSDGLYCFEALKEAGYTQKVIVTSYVKRPQNIPAFKWLNTILGNVKSAITGSCRFVSRKHAGRYLAAYEYRFNRRYDLARMLPALARIAIQAEPRPYKALILAEANG